MEKKNIRILLLFLFFTLISQCVCAIEYRVIKEWGGKGKKTGEFDMPVAVALDSHNNVYVLDGNNARIQKFTVNGEFMQAWGEYGKKEGQFADPKDIAIDMNDNVYVIDTGNNRVQKFSAVGEFLKAWGKSGREKGSFAAPGGITVDSKNNVYIADSGNNRIQVFDREGTFITTWGKKGTGDGEFDNPVSIVVGEDDSVFVADYFNHCIKKFNNSGTFLKKYVLQMKEKSRGYWWPRSMAITPENKLLIVDYYHHSLVVLMNFDSAGKHLAQWVGQDMLEGSLKFPSDITIDSDAHVYIVDSGNNKVKKLKGFSTYSISGYLRDTFDNGIGGVTLFLSGTVRKEVVSKPNGSFAFEDLPEGHYEITFKGSGWEFTPSVLRYNPLSSSQYNQIFKAVPHYESVPSDNDNSW